MLEKYYRYKIKFKNHVVILRIGKFYEVLDKDSLIINKIFGYRLTKLSNTLKCGFPLTSIDKVMEKLNELHINYVIIDDEITDNIEFDDNNFKNYEVDIDVIKYNILGIESITNRLNEMVFDEDLHIILTNIEDILSER